MALINYLKSSRCLPAGICARAEATAATVPYEPAPLGMTSSRFLVRVNQWQR
jgi:hypothetical protein